MLPVLYSFRRCPYAMRARLAIKYAGIEVELREVLLAAKPAQMLQCSPKGTVPVLQLPSGRIIDESMDIINWALAINDPQLWLSDQQNVQMETRQLIACNDGEFKQHLDRYKYADRFPEHSADHYRQQGEVFLQQLEQRLMATEFLFGANIGVADVALFPFIRQFAFVDRDWFEASEYTGLRAWLQRLLAWPLFVDVMGKYPPWKPADKPVTL